VVVTPFGQAGAASPRQTPLVSDPSHLVDPIDGTGTGSVNPGTIGEFPGADVPFGMIQWSPDTTPDLAQSGGLYSYADSRISGFSLTHLSGSGCAAYGDVPILPTVGPIAASPETASDTFTHAAEHAAPGRYSVMLGPSKISTELTVTTRTGLSRFTFPRTHQANVLLKVAGSANPVSGADFRVVGRDEVSGQVTSGQFCGTGTNYTLYFVARFNRPFSEAGGWDSSGISPGLTRCTGPACGAYVTFNATSDRVVLMKVGISFVSVANAADNLRVEDRGWSVANVEAGATRRWNQILNRLRVGGGTIAQQRTFYTALYHSLLYPNVVSDANGEYTGPDGKVHRSATRAEYANFSEWDIYRSEIELESVLAPNQVGDMVQSLVNDAQQGGWLPKWAIVDGDASQMNGDSADPIIAAAYAFGIHDFDASRALQAMVKGATQNETGHGLEIERQYLDQYLTQHYVNAGSLDLTSINYSIGASVTLEYALDDFAIAQLARSLGDHSVYATFMQRAHNWEYEFNPATGFMQARNTDGSFPAGAAFEFSELEAGGQNGFEEGNAIQYTWAVPQDLAALATLMGGNEQAVSKLNVFFTHLNATRFYPYDWAGNEPSLWTPWEYDYFGAPTQTQKTVRAIVNTLYSDTPVNEPGNDDLGAIASWYVWAALGLYPVTPGSADLALSSPLFPRTVDRSSCARRTRPRPLPTSTRFGQRESPAPPRRRPAHQRRPPAAPAPGTSPGSRHRC
jgi:predicted alpha-1,2-mannosidase